MNSEQISELMKSVTEMMTKMGNNGKQSQHLMDSLNAELQSKTLDTSEAKDAVEE